VTWVARLGADDGGAGAAGGTYWVFADGGASDAGVSAMAVSGGGADGVTADGLGAADRVGVAAADPDEWLGDGWLDEVGWGRWLWLRCDTSSADETVIKTSPAAIEAAASTAGVVRYHGALARCGSVSPGPSAVISATIRSTYSAKSSP